MADCHRLLVIGVPRDESELAADFLWRHGAQAVEELPADESGGMTFSGVVRLSTDFGTDPLGAYHSAIANDPHVGHLANGWSVDVREVDALVADTWREFAVPIAIENILIVPTWKPQVAATGNNIAIFIDPGGAFGMGDHPTTRATLRLALRHARTNSVTSVLDLGCGSGVLSIALVLQTETTATAVDIAHPAIQATRHNAETNGVAERITSLHGDVRVTTGTYDLVLANILAPVLLSDAQEIAARVSPGGTLILSGFNDTRSNDIAVAYEALGFRVVGEESLEGWLALQLQR
jgi:ribosomal protein L11 methyltransferase